MTSPQYEPCEQCEAPMDAQQRFCIVCGANRRHPDDPVAHYLQRVRKPAPVAVESTSSSRWGDGRVLLAVLALIPVAAAAGVLVAKDDAKADPNLIAALEAQQKALSKAGPATAAAPVSNVNTGNALSSDFSLDKGFVVQLSTLPFKTTDKAAGDQAVSGAEDDGAKDVGIINPDDFTLKPASGGDYIVYSGEFKTKAEADKALKDLEKDFPDAKVVEVKPLTAGGGGVAGPAGSIDADAEYQATPTQQQEEEGAQVVQEIQDKVGEDYVDQQRQLPDTIVVP